MKRRVTLKEALAISCKKCGGLPELWQDGHYMLTCKVCGEETFISVYRRDVTRAWKEMNRVKI